MKLSEAKKQARQDALKNYKYAKLIEQALSGRLLLAVTYRDRNGQVRSEYHHISHAWLDGKDKRLLYKAETFNAVTFKHGEWTDKETGEVKTWWITVDAGGPVGDSGRVYDMQISRYEADDPAPAPAGWTLMYVNAYDACWGNPHLVPDDALPQATKDGFHSRQRLSIITKED